MATRVVNSSDVTSIPCFVEFLEEGNLPHYFMPRCNLLDCVARRDLDMGVHYIKRTVLVDPIGAIILSPRWPHQLYSSPKPGDGSVKQADIVAGFRQLFQMVIGRSFSYSHSINYIDEMLSRLDTYRSQRFALAVASKGTKGTQRKPNQLMILVELLSQICHICKQKTHWTLGYCILKFGWNIDLQPKISTQLKRSDCENKSRLLKINVACN